MTATFWRLNLINLNLINKFSLKICVFGKICLWLCGLGDAINCDADSVLTWFRITRVRWTAAARTWAGIRVAWTWTAGAQSGCHRSVCVGIFRICKSVRICKQQLDLETRKLNLKQVEKERTVRLMFNNTEKQTKRTNSVDNDKQN